MKFLLATLLIALLAYVAGVYLPWWALAVVAFGVALLLPQHNVQSFFAGFFGIFLMWAALALWIDIKNNSLLSQKIAQLFPLGSSSVALVLFTAFLGGVAGGFAALTGSTMRKLLSKQSI